MVFPFWVSVLKFVSQIVLLLAYVLLKGKFLIIALVTNSSPPLSYKPDPSQILQGKRYPEKYESPKIEKIVKAT